MEAAITLADRGHEVILCEKSSTLGGEMKEAKYISFKQDMEKLRQVLVNRIAERPIEVRLNTEVTPELAKSIDPDAIIAALGAKPKIPDIPGAGGDNVFYAVGINSRLGSIGKKAVIIGGGLVGCELSIQLAQEGREVTVLGRNAMLCRDAPYLHHEGVILEMARNNVKSYTGAVCREITADGVKAVTEGKEMFIPADSVIIATGVEPLSAEAEALRGIAKDFVKIGDCKFPRNMYNALREGFNAAAFLC